MRAVEAIFVGVVATAATDVWQQALQRWCGRPATDWGKVGRWVSRLPGGAVMHHSVTATTPVYGEVAIGWLFHYLVGVAYAALFLAALEAIPAAPSSLVPALVFAAVTLVAPWFVLQPALGLGILARRAPNPAAVRFTTVTTHGMFGLGLALGVDVWRLAAPAA